MSRDPRIAGRLSTVGGRRTFLASSTGALALAVGIAACSSGDGGESTARSTSAYQTVTETANTSFNDKNAYVGTLLGYLQASTVLVGNGEAVVALSPDLLSTLNVAQPEPIPIPSTSQTISTPLNDIDVWVGGYTLAVDMMKLQVNIQGSDIVVGLSAPGWASASAVYHSPLGDVPSGPIRLSAPTVSVSLTVGWDPLGQRLFVERGGAVVSLPGASVTGCTATSWCDDFLTSAMPTLASAVSGRLESALNTWIGTYDRRTDFENFALSICAMGAPAPPPQGANPWRFAYSGPAVGLTIAGDQINCALIRDDNPAPAVLGVVPSAGGPGDTVTIHAQNLTVPTYGADVRFNGVPATNVVCNQGANLSDCIATVPSGSGVVDVQVTNTNGYKTPLAAADQFTYQPLTITGISPFQGSVNGGTYVQITGTGFDVNANVDGSMKATFGGLPTSGVYCDSSTRCFVTSPPSANTGAANVALTLYANTTLPSLASLFVYTGQPAIVGLSWSLAAGATVAIDSYAPPGGAVIALSSDNPTFMAPPATITIPAGSTSTSFFVSFPSSAKNGDATLTASYEGSSMSTPVHLYCPVQKCNTGFAWDGDLCKCTRQPTY